jgi:hypothetical protein
MLRIALFVAIAALTIGTPSMAAAQPYYGSVGWGGVGWGGPGWGGPGWDRPGWDRPGWGGWGPGWGGPRVTVNVGFSGPGPYPIYRRRLCCCCSRWRYPGPFYRPQFFYGDGPYGYDNMGYDGW